MPEDSGPIANLDAERSLIGAALLDHIGAAPLIERLSPEAFFAKQHQTIWAAIRTLHSRGDLADLVTIRALLAQDGRLDGVGGASYVQSLADGGPTEGGAAVLAQMVEEKCFRRKASNAAALVIASCENGGDPASAIRELEHIERPNSRVDVILGSIVAAEDLAMAERPEVSSIIGDRLLTRRNYGILAGRKGSGKSWLALQAAFSVSRGEPWLTYPTTRGRVLLYSLEMDRADIEQRLRSIAGDSPLGKDLLVFGRDSLPARCGMSPIPKLARADDQADLLRVIESIEPDLLVLDPIGPTMSNEGQELEAVSAFLFDLTARTGCAALITHHMRKTRPDAGSDDDISAIRNAGQFVDRASMVGILKQSRGGKVFAQHPPRHTGPQPDIWLETLPSGVLDLADGAPLDPADRVAERETLLREALAERGQMTRADVARTLGVSERTAARCLSYIGARQIGNGRSTQWALEL